MKDPYSERPEPFRTLTDQEMDRCYTRLDGSFGGYRPRHSHRIKDEDIMPDPEEPGWLQDQYDEIRTCLELLCQPDMVHFALSVFPSCHGSKSEVANTKTISRSKIRLDEQEIAEWLLVYWCVMEALKRRRFS